MRIPTLGLLLPLALLVVPIASAQSSASQSATISATVISALSMTKSQDLAFGSIAQGTARTVAVTDASAAKFTIIGHASTPVTVSYTAPANLTSASNTLPFSAIVRAHTADAPASSSALPSGGLITLNGSGHGYVFLGGTLTASASQAVGAYSGSFSIRVDY